MLNSGLIVLLVGISVCPGLHEFALHKVHQQLFTLWLAHHGDHLAENSSVHHCTTGAVISVKMAIEIVSFPIKNGDFL